MAARGAARDTTTVSGTVPASSSSRARQRQLRERVEHHPPRLARRERLRVRAADAGRQHRVIGERGADPDRDRITRRPPLVGELAAALAGDPLRVAAAGRDLAVERHRGLEQDPGAAGAGVLAERLVQEPRAGRDLAVRRHHLDALVAEDPEAASGGVLGRVIGRDHDAGDPGLADRVGAGRRAAVVAARLERHVHGRSG